MKQLWNTYHRQMKEFFKAQARIALTSLMGMMLVWGNLHFPLPSFFSPSKTIAHPISVSPLQKKNKDHEVFGFAPYWKLNELGNIDFNVLTTLAYFSIPVNADGNLNAQDPGYIGFESQSATDLFTKAHQAGTRVVLTITQMDNASIQQLLDNPSAQDLAINQTTNFVKSRGIDGVNVDFEYTGDPGSSYRNEFSTFVQNLSDKMHQEVQGSKVSVSVYATAVKNPQLDDISALSKSSDTIFMMAYDFATGSSDVAMPTAPLYGYKAGKYWYDISTAVEDFLTVMPSQKLILGLPWYGYNYAVSSPSINATTYSGYYSNSLTQTYADIQNLDPSQTSGWDPYGEVGWKAYYDPTSGVWRMVFVEDTRSLGIKYDFAKSKNLAGVGIWALGFDNGTQELWNSLEGKFGIKYADAKITGKPIN